MRRNLGASPMRRLCRQLQERGVDLGRLRALEVFGDDGTRHTLDYAPMVASLDIWEIRSDREATLRPRSRFELAAEDRHPFVHAQQSAPRAGCMAEWQEAERLERAARHAPLHWRICETFILQF